jgi:hypothetical protein
MTVHDRTHDRLRSAPAALRAGAFLFLALCLLSLPCPAAADTVSLGAGPGFWFSHSSTAIFLRYEREAAPLFGQDGFWAATAVAWDGPNRAEAIGISRGLRWPFGDAWHADAEFGLNWISHTTDNLGTPVQALLRAAVGKRFDSLDVSLSVLHYSNARWLFGWDGPNNGENFVVLGLGWRFE